MRVGVHVTDWDREVLAARGDDVLDVYAEAMDVDPATARSRRSILSSHLQRDGLLAVAAEDDDGRLVGIAYGYLGGRGQWWHEQVRAALDDATATRWLDDSFEVCELHVRPELHGTGLGRTLLERLLAGTPARTAVLSTPDAETRARAFYRAGGWVDLVTQLRFPGDPRLFAVLGRDLVGSSPVNGT